MLLAAFRKYYVQENIKLCNIEMQPLSHIYMRPRNVSFCTSGSSWIFSGEKWKDVKLFWTNLKFNGD